MADKILNPKTGRMVSITGKIGKAIAAATGVAPEGKIYNPKTKRFVKATPKRVKEAAVAKMASRPAPKKIDPEIEAYERKVFELENELFKLRKIRDETLAMAENLTEKNKKLMEDNRKKSDKLKKDAKDAEEKQRKLLRTLDYMWPPIYAERDKTNLKITELLDIVEQTDKKISRVQKELKSLVKPLTSKAKDVAKKIPEDILNRILAMADESISAKYKNIPPAVLAKFNQLTKDVPSQLKRHWREDWPKFLNKNINVPFQLFEYLVFEDEDFEWFSIEDGYDEYLTVPDEGEKDWISTAYYNILAYAFFISQTTDQLEESIEDDDSPFSATKTIFVSAYSNYDRRVGSRNPDKIIPDDYLQRRNEIIDEIISEAYAEGVVFPKPTKNLLDSEDEEDEDESTKDFLKEFFEFVVDNISFFNKYFEIETKYKKDSTDWMNEFDDKVEARYDELLEENEEPLDEEREEELREQANDDVSADFSPTLGQYEIYFVGK